MRKASVITVRVTEEEKNKLHAESEMESITLNTLVSKILAKHVRWDYFTKDIGYIFVTRPFLRALLENVDEKTIMTIAVSTCRGAIRDAIIFMSGEMNLKNFLAGMDMWLGASNIAFRHITEDHTDKYIVKHDLGKKFSLYLNTVINSVLNEIGYKSINQITDDQSNSFEIEKI